MKFRLNHSMIIVMLLMYGCASEYPVSSPNIGTDIILFSEFPKQDGDLHQLLYEQFTMNCSNNSSITVHTPEHLTEDFITDPKINTQYKVVVGNDEKANTIYFKDVRSEKLADALVKELNEFLVYYYQATLESIPKQLLFRKSCSVSSTSYLSKLLRKKEDTSLKLKIGISTSIEENLRQDFIVHVLAHLTHSLGSDCAPIFSKTADLKVYLPDSCNCPVKQPKMKVYEYWYWEL